MKSSFRLLLAGITLFSFSAIGCGGGGGSDGAAVDTTPASNNNTFYSNPTDSRVLTVENEEDRSTYTYNGDIDSDGQLIRLTSIVVQDPELEEDLVYFLDEKGYPAMIHTPEFTFELESISNTAARLTAISTSGEVRVNMPLQLEADDEVSVSEASMEETVSRSIQSQAQNSAANMYITLTKCGELVEDAVISVNIDPQIGTSNPVGAHVGDGRYAFHIPSTVDPKVDMLKKCDAIAEKITSYCPLLDLIPPDIKTCDELANSVGNIPFVGSKYMASVKKYCIPALLKHLPKIKTVLCNSEMIADIKNVCKWNIILDEPVQSHSFSLSVQIPGSEAFVTQSVSFSPNLPSSWDLIAPNEISMEKLYIVPSDPESDEWYTAYASMVCPDPEDGTTVTISVRGSDGHTGSVEEVIKVNSTISLDIPPASDSEKEVTDTITVTADGQTLGVNTLAVEDRTWTMVVQRAADETNNEELPDDEEITTWYVWYADNIGLNPVMVGTNESYSKDTLCSSYPGGGLSPTTMMEKIAIVEKAESKEKAIEAACRQFTNIRAVPASSTFIFSDWLADRSGERHDIDELSGCQ